MVQPLEQITAAALALPFEEREPLVDRLPESMDADGEFPLSEAWAAEIKRRQPEVV